MITITVGLSVLLTAVLAAGLLVSGERRGRRMADHGRQIQISAPPLVDPAGATVFWATLAEALRTGWRGRLRHGRAYAGYEYRWDGRQLRIVVWLPRTVAVDPVLAAIRGAWPGAACKVAAATVPLPSPSAGAAGASLAPVLPGWYPLRTEHHNDPLRTLISAAGQLRTGEQACVQILARPATGRARRRLIRGVRALRGGPAGPGLLDPAGWLLAVLDFVTGAPPRPTGRSTTPADPQRERDARAALDQLAGPHWEVAVRCAVSSPRDAAGPARAIAAAFGPFTARNRLRARRLRHPAHLVNGRRLRHGFLLTPVELAMLGALPRDIAVPGMDRARAKAMPAPTEIATGGRDAKVLGRAEVGGHSVALRAADARQHLHLLGSTGSGKSTLLLNLILDDIHAGRGTVVIDPKGDLVTDLLDRIPLEHARRLVLLDPDQPDGPTLNPLEGADHDLLVDNVVSIFGRIFAKHWGPRIDDTLRVACLTLLRKPGATLTQVPELLNERDFRRKYTQDLDDPAGLGGYWSWYETSPLQLRSTVIAPVLARLRSLLLRDFVRHTFGSARSSFHMGRVLDGGILLARLPKGQIGEETARVMGSFVLASAWQAATARARLPADKRRDAAVYIDEAHNFLNLPGSVADMLAEARGYGLSLGLAHQNLAQMPRETQLAVSANARNKVFFSCAPEDATQLARHTAPELDDHDLSHLDAYTAACRLIVAGRETAAFTLRTPPPRPALGTAGQLREALARPRT
ncbi:type IV secretory system conjugative DNA transfer family protein [Actinoplanes sp. HUAS TT8]|uniref:type IV secretory system conjugative DNA transfer family protein n=1 Tax=Actinoplanes sp. HUAS TT8 TaxID=3447453 RepID=UPI003F52329F